MDTDRPPPLHRRRSGSRGTEVQGGHGVPLEAKAQKPPSWKFGIPSGEWRGSNHSDRGQGRPGAARPSPNRAAEPLGQYCAGVGQLALRPRSSTQPRSSMPLPCGAGFAVGGHPLSLVCGGDRPLGQGWEDPQASRLDCACRARARTATLVAGKFEVALWAPSPLCESYGPGNGTAGSRWVRSRVRASGQQC